MTVYDTVNYTQINSYHISSPLNIDGYTYLEDGVDAGDNEVLAQLVWELAAELHQACVASGRIDSTNRLLLEMGM